MMIGQRGADQECFLESGDGSAAFGSGNFCADPASQIRLREPSMILNLRKVAAEWRVDAAGAASPLGSLLRQDP
jgi:hypothetical protein